MLFEGEAHKRRHNEGEGVDDRAITTYSIDYMYLTEKRQCRGERWSSKNGQRKHDVGMTDHRGRGQGDWSAKAAATPGLLQELQRDMGRSRVVLKADQEVALADVQRQVVAARLGETVPMNCPVGESQRTGRVENAV